MLTLEQTRAWIRTLKAGDRVRFRKDVGAGNGLSNVSGEVLLNYANKIITIERISNVHERVSRKEDELIYFRDNCGERRTDDNFNYYCAGRFEPVTNIKVNTRRMY